ncbi:MAG: hypothetical protein LC635_00570 [Pseudonocardiaceae bacterium]|nr:hypothetical protein [Pseudonocardiaceae bacterium]
MVQGSAVQSASLVYSNTGGVLTVSTGNQVIFATIHFEPARAAGSSVETDLELPGDARVERVRFVLAAQPGGFTELASVAEVREANPVNSGAKAACAIDFGRLVTVGGLGFEGGVVVLHGPVISTVYSWTGAGWLFRGGGASPGTFPELAADRLLVETLDDVDGAEFAAFLLAHGAVRLPALPNSLELLVDGITVWFERQGSVPGTEVEQPAGGVAFEVDRTDVVREAFGRAKASGGVRKVRVALRAATPGELQLQPIVSSLRVHLVQFPPEGLARTVDVPEEGLLSFDVTPPGTATDVPEIDLVVRGAFGPERVQPVIGPSFVPDAKLALAPARPVLLGIPALLTNRFAALTGVRLGLGAADGGSGGEVAGRLLADNAGRPGEPLPGAELTACRVPAGARRWHTLGFAEAVALPAAPALAATPDAEVPLPTVGAWLELQLSYGEIECALTLAGPGDPDAPGARLLRRLPGAGTAPLTTVDVIGELRAAIRLVGRPDSDRSIPAVSFSVPRSDTEPVGANPTGDDLHTTLALVNPVRPSDKPKDRPAVELTALVAAPGSLTLDTVRVAYREAAPT